MQFRRSNLWLWSGLAVGLVLTGTGAGTQTQAQAAVPASDAPDDTPEILEFLGSPEANSDLWKAFLEIVPDQLQESIPANAEVSGTKGEDE